MTRRACRRSLLGLLGLAPLGLVGGCAKPGVEKPARGPVLTSPVDAMPPDLELSIRVAVDRLREALPEATLAELGRQSRLGAGLGEPLVTRALERTKTAWAGFRLGRSPEQADNVLVLKGKFEELVPGGDHWLTPEDLGAGWQCWQRRQPVARAVPTRVYTYVDEIMLFVSEAEIDAVERRLFRGYSAPALAPPERGVLAIASSMPALGRLLAREAPRAASLLAQGNTVKGFFDIDSSGVAIDLSFEFQEPAQAERAARAANLLAASLVEQNAEFQKLLATLKLDALGDSVALRLKLSPEALLGIMGCAPGAACS